MPGQAGDRIGRTQKLVAILMFLLIFIGSNCHAADPGQDQVRLVRPGNPAAQITGLSWDTAPIRVVIKSSEGVPDALVEIQGKFRAEDSRLIHDSSRIPLTNERFILPVRLTGTRTFVHFLAVDAWGKVTQETITLLFPEWARIREKSAASPTKDSIFLGIGASSIRFTQTRTYGFEGIFTVLKAAYQAGWKNHQNMDWGFTGFFSALPMKMNRSDTSFQFLGLNARVGYVLPGLEEPWRLSIMGGAYYTTMIGPFGYNHVGGPMLYPVLRRVMGDRDFLTFYLKFSPITDGLQFLALENREMAVGTSWTRRVPGSHPFGVSLDIADLSMTSGGIVAQSRSLSVGLSYGL